MRANPGSTSSPRRMNNALANILARLRSAAESSRLVLGASRRMFRASSPMPPPHGIILERMAPILFGNGISVRRLMLISSREVHQLQQKLRRLESAVARPAGAAESRRVSQDGRLADGPDTDPTTSHLETPRFVGPENGVGFFLSRLTAYQEGQANGPVAPQLQPSSIVYHPPHPLPPRHVALSAVEE